MRKKKKLVEADKCPRYFKFAFVRTPCDRLVSWYCMVAQARVTNRFGAYVRAVAPTFEAFVKHATTGLGERTTHNQLDYVTDATGAMLVDFVGRYERLLFFSSRRRHTRCGRDWSSAVCSSDLLDINQTKQTVCGGNVHPLVTEINHGCCIIDGTPIRLKFKQHS